jgi:hypothetical protein
MAETDNGIADSVVGEHRSLPRFRRLFLLSPASTSGRRAQLLFNDRAEFPLAVQIRKKRGAALGDVFSFLSGLYFRGKLTYARAFGNAARGVQPALVITPERGLVSPDARVTLADLRAFAGSPIDLTNPSYRDPLLRAAEAIAQRASGHDVVLLGSIASGKYVDLLMPIFGERLLFPQEFVGRGDMSRGGLMLRCADTNSELTYVAVAGAVRHGARPAKLAPR